MGGWSVIVNFLFPIPLISLLLICLPLPSFLESYVNRGVNFLLNKILFFKIAAGFNLYQVATLLSSLLFVEAIYSTVKAGEKQLSVQDLVKGEYLKCQRWRCERNFWIAFFSLVLWVVLYRVHRLIKDLEAYKKEKNQ